MIFLQNCVGFFVNYAKLSAFPQKKRQSITKFAVDCRNYDLFTAFLIILLCRITYGEAVGFNAVAQHFASENIAGNSCITDLNL
jgi:hypothetical protein